jgi:hypothetical protein
MRERIILTAPPDPRETTLLQPQVVSAQGVHNVTCVWRLATTWQKMPHFARCWHPPDRTGVVTFSQVEDYERPAAAVGQAFSLTLQHVRFESLTY